MTTTAFLSGVCRLISDTISAVYTVPLLAFFMTCMLLAVVAGLLLYMFRKAKRF